MSRRWRCADADFSATGQAEFAKVLPEACVALEAAGVRWWDRYQTHQLSAVRDLGLRLAWWIHLEDASVVLEHAGGAAALHGRTRRYSGRGRSRAA